MKVEAAHGRCVALVLALAAARTLLAGLGEPAPDLLDERTGPPTVLPKLDSDGWVRLSWLPGIGASRAQRIVAERAQLGVPLTAERLDLLPGIGPGTAAEALEWLAAGGRSPPGPPLE